MTQEKKNGKIIAIITMIFLFGMISFVTNLAAPMGIVLKNQFDVSNALGMLGNFGNFIAYAVMGIPSGILLQRVGYKKTALIAVAIGFIGVGIQFLSGHSSPEMAFAVYLIGAFVAGFSMCLLNTVVNPMLNKLGGEGNKGNQLIQVGGSFNSVMATITPMFVGILIAGSIEKATISQIFPVMYTAMAVFAFAFFVLLFVRIPEPNAATTTEPISTLMKGALKFRHFVLGAIAIFVYVGIEVGVPGTLNLFLTDPVEKGGAGIASTISGFVVGTYWFLMLIGRLAGASLGAKVSSKAMLTFTSGLGLILVFLAIFSSTGTLVNLPVLQQSATGGLSFGFAEVPINAMYLVLVGFCTSIMWGGIFNLAVEGLGKYLAAASGLFMVLVCGGGNKGNQLIQVGGSFNSVMATITPMFVGILIAGSIEKATISQIFPVMYTAMAVFAFAFFVLLFVRIPEPNAATTTEPISTLMKGALKFRHFVLGAIAIFVYVGIEVGVPGTLNLFLTDPVEKGGAGIASTISGFVVGTYWFLMLIGRLAGASLGAKVSSKAMLTFTSALGLILVFLAIFSSTGTLVNLPVLQQSATGGLSFGFAEVPINAMYLVLVGLCTSIMWGGIFNLAVEGLGKYLAAASGLFMVLVCGGGILPVIQGWVADVAGFMASYWVIIAALAYLLYYGLVGCKNVNKDIPVE